MATPVKRSEIITLMPKRHNLFNKLNKTIKYNYTNNTVTCFSRTFLPEVKKPLTESEASLNRCFKILTKVPRFMPAKNMTAKPIEPYCNIKGFQTALCVRHRGHPLTEDDKARNKQLSKTRYVVEQSFATLHRKTAPTTVSNKPNRA